LDDYLHRGDHQILRDMSFHVYSMWVYRAQLNPYAANRSPSAQTKPRHLDTPFDDSLVAGRTWVRRLALEPRIPKVEGPQFVTDVDPEMHFLLKAVLLRPIYLGPAVEDDDTKQVRVLRAVCCGHSSSFAQPLRAKTPGLR
jgi:hypothetical protein